MRLHVNMHLRVHMRLHILMHLHVRRGLPPPCNQRTRSGCRARFVGYERLEDMNDSRFSHFYSHTFPQVDTCTEMEVMNGSFITCHSCQANRSQPPTVHILQKCPSACGRARHGPACGRAQRELGMRPTCGWTRRELDTWPPPQRQNRATKKGRTGVSNPVRPRRARFLAVATLGKTSSLDRAGPLQPNDHSGRCDVAIAA